MGARRNTLSGNGWSIEYIRCSYRLVFLSDSGSQVSFIAKNLRHPSVPIDDFKLIVRDSYNIQIPSIGYLHFNSFPMQSKDRYFNSN